LTWADPSAAPADGDEAAGGAERRGPARSGLGRGSGLGQGSGPAARSGLAGLSGLAERLTWPTWVPTAVRATLPTWLASRVAVALLASVTAGVLSGAAPSQVPGFRDLWNRWDVGLFTKVARWGYHSPQYADKTDVDFPGMPLAIHLVHLVARDWIISGILVSFIAGAVAAAALWRLSADDVGPEKAQVSVLTLILFPYAVFLFAGYSEALFLAFASTAWLAATRHRWWLAGLLAAGAAGTRVTGIPLAIGLAVQYVVERRRAGERLIATDGLALGLPVLPVLGFLAYLHGKTGRWNSYTLAMKEGWHRWIDWPWVGWRQTWDVAFHHPQSSAWAWFWRGELGAVVVGVMLTIVLLRSARWGEATFLGAATLLMSSSNFYASGIRTILVAFPLYLALGRGAARVPWLRGAYIWLSAPVMAAFVVAFTQGQWVD